MKLINFKNLILITVLANYQCLIASEYQINDIYGVDIWGGSISETFDQSISTFQIESCNSITLSLFPQTALNDTKYSLYTSEGTFVSYSDNDYQFRSIPSGNYIVKDGDVTIFQYIKTFTNPNTLYEVVLTDNSQNEILDFSSTVLNSIQLSAAIKNLNTLEIDQCGPYINWRLNGNSISDITSANFVEGDILCVGIDGIENCTMGCYFYAESCYTITEPLSINNTKKTIDFKYFPNPTDNFIFIKNKAQTIKKIVCLDANSRIVGSQTFENQSKIEFDFTLFKSGLYFIKIITNENSTIVKKVIKK